MVKAFNERPSPRCKNPNVIAVQLLTKLLRSHPGIVELAANDLGCTDFEEVLHEIVLDLVDDGVMQECECCGGIHRADFYGDCRNDNERL